VNNEAYCSLEQSIGVWCSLAPDPPHFSNQPDCATDPPTAGTYHWMPCTLRLVLVLLLALVPELFWLLLQVRQAKLQSTPTRKVNCKAEDYLGYHSNILRAYNATIRALLAATHSTKRWVKGEHGV